ncbi:hypothetical protein M5G13_27420, partial [Pseudomonas sp. TNT2022 ID609]|nr:hypothetical protein [Pseudomonas rubra]
MADADSDENPATKIIYANHSYLCPVFISHRTYLLTRQHNQENSVLNPWSHALPVAVALATLASTVQAQE